MNNTLLSKKTLAWAALAIALPFAALSHAESTDKPKHCQHGGERGHFFDEGKQGAMGIPPHLKGLDLTEAQQDKVFAIMHAQAPNMYEDHKQHRKLIEELRALSQADSFDQAKANQISDQLGKLEKDKAINMATNQAKIFALLTPEQRKKMREQKMSEPGFGNGHDHGSDNGHDHGFESTSHKRSDLQSSQPMING